MLKVHIKRTIIVGILGAVIALLYGLLSPKVYEGRVEMLLSDETRQGTLSTSNVFSSDVLSILEKNRPQGAQTERQLLSSLSIFYQAVARYSDEQGDRALLANWNQLYEMYDIETARQQNNAAIDAGVALIKVRAYNPKAAAGIANAIPVVYNERRLQNSRESVQEALNYLQTKMSNAERELKAAETRLKDYKSETSIPDIPKAKQDYTNTLTILEQSRQRTATELEGAKAAAATSAAQLATLPKSEVTGSSSGKTTEVLGYEQELARLNAERESLLTVYLPDAIQVKQNEERLRAIQNKLAAAKKKNATETSVTTKQTTPVYSSMQNLAETQKIRVQELESQLAEYDRQIAQQKTIVAGLPEKELQMNAREREYLILDMTYKNLRAQSEDLKTRTETAYRSALVLNTATEDDESVAPDIKKFALVGGTAGLCLGILLSYILESLKLRIQSSTQLTALTGLPVVAAIPASAKTGAKALRGINQSGSPIPEAFRYMAFSMVTNQTKTMRTLMFTGVRTAMTTYSSAAQFAMAVADGGTRVLLVDGDMLKSPISRALDASGRQGLSDLLAAESSAQVQDYIIETVHPNLSLLPGGTDPSIKFMTNAPQPKLEAILQALRISCDVIVFAVPPCDVLADASCLARHVDDVCLVVSAAQTNYRAVPLAQDLLMKAGAKNISIVMADASADEEPFAKRSAYLTRAG
ncbi:MAG: hypothetical protein JST40_05875 [Armatimonadetes bacterium]|nr:hypothetical protein [Armatimonadota bacterium]